MIWDFLLEIFHIHEQFAAGEPIRRKIQVPVHKCMYILAHAGFNSTYAKVIH
jgi:hypothetical protein